MKKIISSFLVFLLCGVLSACIMGNDVVKDALEHNGAIIKESPDKYTWYIRDYVGKNLESFGEGKKDRYEKYGNGRIYFTFVTTDGSVVDKDNLDEYIVISQNTAPNTVLKYQYKKSSDGTEYDTLIETQSIERIELKVARLEKKDTTNTTVQENTISEKAQIAMNHIPTTINTSPDKYTWYMKDYVGRRLNNVGTVRLGGFLMDDYGDGGIKFILLVDDGSEIDLENENELKNYIVTSQGVAPNSEIKYTFMKKSDGAEYDNLIDYQNIEEVELYVTKIYQ